MPARLFLSSGDLMADRRFDFARDLQLKGDLPAAADLLLQAIELAPNFASAWFTLGEIREQLGERDAAIAAFRKAHAADPDDRHGASLRLMRLGAEPVGRRCRKAMCRRCSISTRRGSNRRWWTISAIAARNCCSGRCCRCARAARKPAFFKRAIDLGCGTGLAATAFAKEVDHFIGIDLSPRMIEKARATGFYAELEVADMVQGLRGKPDASADLILAADAMVYVADLAPVLAEAARVLAPAACSRSPPRPMTGEGVIIGEGLRYAHAAAYVRAAVEAAGLKLSLLEDRSARNEDNIPVPGLVVVATKT